MDGLLDGRAAVFARTMPPTHSAYASSPVSSSPIMGNSLKNRLMLLVSPDDDAFWKEVRKVSRREARKVARVWGGESGRFDVGYSSRCSLAALLIADGIRRDSRRQLLRIRFRRRPGRWQWRAA